MLRSLLLIAALALSFQSDAMARHEPMPPMPPVPPMPQGPQGPQEPQDPPVAPSVPAAPSHLTVMIRKCVHEPWQKQGCYNCIHDAQDAARAMQAQGFLVSIR